MYAVSRMINIFTSQHRGNRALTESLESVNEWAKYHDFPNELTVEISKYLRYKNSHCYFDEKTVMSGLSTSLRLEFTRIIYERAMNQVELFKQCSNSFLCDLMLSMRSEFCSPYSIIIPHGMEPLLYSLSFSAWIRALILLSFRRFHR